MAGAVEGAHRLLSNDFDTSGLAEGWEYSGTNSTDGGGFLHVNNASGTWVMMVAGLNAVTLTPALVRPWNVAPLVAALSVG
jgi:hypothetical protein